MIIVVDTNIMIAAIIKPSLTQSIILKEEFKFYSPEFLKDEIEKHKDEILKKSGYTQEEFEIVLSIIYSGVTIVPEKEYGHLKEEVLGFAPDKDDWPFLALAKHLGASLWSNDSDLKKKQNIITVMSTSDLIEVLKKNVKGK